jgi:hypothetical protein
VGLIRLFFGVFWGCLGWVFLGVFYCQPCLKGRLKTVSALCLEAGRKRLLVGTEGGNIYLLRLWNLIPEQEIIYQVHRLPRSPNFIWAPVYSCTHCLRPRTVSPPPSHLGSYTRAPIG